MKLRPHLTALVIGSLLFSGGCQIVPDAQPDPTEFYVLTYPGNPSASAGSVDGVTLGLHEIRLPVYLGDSRAMVVRDAGNRITYRDFERWAEPLDEGIERILRIGLTQSPGVARVLTLPFPAGIDRDYDLQVTVLTSEGLERDDLQQVLLALDYSVLTPEGDLVTHGIYRAPVRDWDGSADDLARLLSQAIAASADTIAGAVPSPEKTSP